MFAGAEVNTSGAGRTEFSSDNVNVCEEDTRGRADKVIASVVISRV